MAKKQTISDSMYNAFKNPISIRGLTASVFMLALQVYVLENSSSGVLVASATFSAIMVSISAVTHFSWADPNKVKAWVLVHVVSQVFVRVLTVSVLCTMQKTLSLLVTLPMVIVAVVFSAHAHTVVSPLKALANGLFFSPLVLVVALRPKFDSLEPPFTSDDARHFMLWRLGETLLVTVWDVVLCSTATRPLMNVWALIVCVVVGVLVAVVSWSRIPKADQLPTHRRLP
eukprot:c970_g1_i1.p1 GENE.c970_g1_i1~~c970_g1_i1.p1  ORF type:complete len:229 (-),score=61.62 c970_g1_i1:153-839(-)